MTFEKREEIYKLNYKSVKEKSQNTKTTEKHNRSINQNASVPLYWAIYAFLIMSWMHAETQLVRTELAETEFTETELAEIKHNQVRIKWMRRSEHRDIRVQCRECRTEYRWSRKECRWDKMNYTFIEDNERLKDRQNAQRTDNNRVISSNEVLKKTVWKYMLRMTLHCRHSNISDRIRFKTSFTVIMNIRSIIISRCFISFTFRRHLDCSRMRQRETRSKVEFQNRDQWQQKNSHFRDNLWTAETLLVTET